MKSRKERVPYETIKGRVLDAYFDFCRDRGLVGRRSQEEILGGITYEFENAFELPLENLMLCVVQLVLSGGWHPNAEAYLREQISDQLAEFHLDNLLVGLPQEEASLFRHDLDTLRLS